MKRFVKVMFVVGSAALLFATTAQAQTVTSTSNPDPLVTPEAAVDITLTGIIQSSIALAVSSTGGNVLSGPPLSQNMSVGRSRAEFNFGGFNTQQAAALGNGTLSRAGTGAFAVASLSAQVTITGSPNNASILMSTVEDTTGSSPIQDGNIRFSRPSALWTAVGDGTNLAWGAAGVEFCPGGATPGCLSGTPYPHDLAVYIPDDQAAGDFSQVISYDASIM